MRLLLGGLTTYSLLTTYYRPTTCACYWVDSPRSPSQSLAPCRARCVVCRVRLRVRVRVRVYSRKCSCFGSLTTRALSSTSPLYANRRCANPNPNPIPNLNPNPTSPPCASRRCAWR
eukprot:scaffold122402_cov49-Phaeocystis_antarctica.AAC.4